MSAVTCECGKVFEARPADIKRGWAKSCSKSCAARQTNKKTGNYQRYCDQHDEREKQLLKHGQLCFANGSDGHDCNKD